MKKLLNKITALIATIIGIVIMIPFIVNVFILGRNYHTMTWPVVAMSFFFILGGVMTMYNLITLAVRNPSRNGSMIEQDISRIRYASEMTNKK